MEAGSFAASVLSTIRAALSINAAEREPAQAALQAWEADAAPGFCSSLIRIVEEHAVVDEVSEGSGAARRAWRAVGGAPRAGRGRCLADPPSRHSGPPSQPTRLLAAVILKNTVGSSWRKTLGTREWSRVPAEEKAGVREAVLKLLLSDPSDR